MSGGDLRVGRHQWRKAILTDERLTPATKVIAAGLETIWINGESGEAWPSLETMADALSVSVRTVRDALRRLAELRYLIVRTGGGRRRTSRYSLTLPHVEASKVVRLRPLPREKGEGEGNHRPADRPAARSPRPANPPRSATVHRLETRQRAQRNPAKSCTPYREHPNEHSTSAMRMVAVKPEDPGTRRWRRWLERHGLPDLDEIAPGTDCGGLAVPFLTPPDDDDMVEQAIVRRWLAMARAETPGICEEEDRRAAIS